MVLRSLIIAFIGGIVLGLVVLSVILVNQHWDRVYAQLKDWKVVPLPEPLTELYFEDHQTLPAKLENGKEYTFRFTVHNLEYRDLVYPYTVTAISSASATPIASGTINLPHDGYQTASASFTLKDTVNRTKIEVELTNLKQKIHFYLD
jgi:hypothetical protein